MNEDFPRLHDLTEDADTAEGPDGTNAADAVTDLTDDQVLAINQLLVDSSDPDSDEAYQAAVQTVREAA